MAGFTTGEASKLREILIDKNKGQITGHDRDYLNFLYYKWKVSYRGEDKPKFILKIEEILGAECLK